jgi:hypothetical protein
MVCIFVSPHQHRPLADMGQNLYDFQYQTDLHFRDRDIYDRINNLRSCADKRGIHLRPGTGGFRGQWFLVRRSNDYCLLCPTPSSCHIRRSHERGLHGTCPYLGPFSKRRSPHSLVPFSEARLPILLGGAGVSGLTCPWGLFR